MNKIETFKQISPSYQRFDLLKYLHGTSKDLNMIYGLSNLQTVVYRPLLGTNGVIILSQQLNNIERFLSMLLYQYLLYNIGTQAEVLLIKKDGQSTQFTELIKKYPQLKTITLTTENIQEIHSLIEVPKVQGVPPKLVIFHELVQDIVDVDTPVEDNNYELTRKIQELYILVRQKGQVPIITGDYQDTILEYKEGFIYNTDRIYITDIIKEETVPFQLVRQSSSVLDSEIYTMLSISQSEPNYKEELQQLNSILLTNYYYLEKKKDLQ